MRGKKGTVFRALGGLMTAAMVLYLTAVTAGAENFSAAAAAVWRSVPEQALRWELGDFGVSDSLSAAAVLALQEAPLLLSAREAVEAAEQATPAPEAKPPEAEQSVIVPVEERPLVAETAADNGVAARTLVPTDPAGYTVSGRVYLSNTTDYTLTPEELKEPFAASLGEGDPQILILHTHGSEGYTPAEDKGIVWSGAYRTTDCRYNVVAAGDEMAEVFGAMGISVLHDRTLYDYPSYTDAYERSLAAIEKYLDQYPSIRFVLDVHRDAIEDAAGNQYKVVCDTAEGTSAQMTLVLGSDGGGLSHPRWRENVKLAAAIQESLLGEHEALMRPILLRNSRYNQHATTGSLLVEVGAAGNSPEEAALAARLFAEGMGEILLGK